MVRTFIACAAIAALAGTASAATIKAKYEGLAQNTGTYSISMTHSNGTISANVNAGALKHKAQNDSELFAGQMLRTFCIDIAQNVVGQIRTYNVVSVASAPEPEAPTGAIGTIRAGYLQSLYANAMQAGLIDHRGSATDAMTNQQAAAFQLVVWELAFEDAGVLSAAVGLGNYKDLLKVDAFKVTNSINATVFNLTEGFFEWAFSGDKLGGLRAMVSPTAQDQLVIIPDPLPTGAGLALAGLAGVAIRRRR